MKASMFNFIYKQGEDANVLYNTFSKAIGIMTNKELSLFDMFRDHDNHTENSSTIKTLKENGFIVDDDFDEIAFLKYFNYKTKFSNEQLSLTIAPTLECNFACPYCYENARKGRMKKSIQNKLIDYISDKIDTGVKSLAITWYGGEPLICPETVDYIATKINSITKKKNISITMSMVSNGYFVNDDIVAMLTRNNILTLQITLDGLADNHNKRRYLQGGGSTFDKIYSNLNCFKKSGIRVNIRMNVDNENYIDFAELKKMIEKIEDVDIDVYPAMVENLSGQDVEQAQHFMTQSDYEQFIMSDCSVRDILYVVDNRSVYCGAELENCYVVDDKGNFYKCWQEIGKEKSICFNLADCNKVNYLPIINYVADDPFADQECASCKFLPLCFGECRFRKNTLKNSKCTFSDEIVRSFIERKYFCK